MPRECCWLMLKKARVGFSARSLLLRRACEVSGGKPLIRDTKANRSPVHKSFLSRIFEDATRH